MKAGKSNFCFGYMELFITTIIFIVINFQISAQRFTITETLSEGAQTTTIAFDGLAFFTGSLGADSFFPPGKVADFWGFQFLRDNDPSEMGHNTDFLTKASFNMLNNLSTAQMNLLIDLAKKQVASINQYGYNRFVLMKAFRRLISGDVPSGKPNLCLDSVKAYSALLYKLDGQISYERARVMGAILASLTTQQRASLDSLKGKGMLTWPNLTEPASLRGLTQDEKVAVMTYGGDLFSWYLGNVEADVYFCPERQGTYFGSFYLKDAPAVGNPGYSIGTNITADYGNNFLNTLTSSDAQKVRDLFNTQKASLNEIVERRRDVSTLLRQFIAGNVPDSAAVMSLMERYGVLDGVIVYNNAVCFSDIYKRTTSAMQAKLMNYRTELIGSLNPTGAYLYASAIPIPVIPNTDFLFTGTVTQQTGDYKIVGTGVTSCYNNTTTITCPSGSTSPFYGQFPGTTLPSYQNNNNGTITDLNTGLTWQSSPDANGNGNSTIEKADKLTWQQIQTRVAALNSSAYGSYSDWRIPTIKELYSLTNWNGTDPSGYNGTATTGLTPFIDNNYFPFAWGQTSAGERLIDVQYASSSLYNELSFSGSQQLFGFNFADGRIKGYDLKMPGGNDKTFSFIAVRGNTTYGINDFSDNNDGTITDKATALMWAKEDSKTGMNWEQALAWAQTKNSENYCGHNDWRLPNAKELQSIVDYTRSPGSTNSASINALFSCSTITNEAGYTDWPWFWTSTTHKSYDGTNYGGSWAVYVCFGRAAGWVKKPGNSFYSYYDAHGAGAQRSSPKSGTFFGNNIGNDSLGRPVYALGPQGDIIRINNYVRLVRDVSVAASLSAPSLSSPADQSTGVFPSAQLTWNSSAGATSYNLQVSTVQDFSTLTFSQSVANGVTYTVTGLKPNTKYYWRACAVNGTATSSYSSAWSFTTAVYGDVDANGVVTSYDAILALVMSVGLSASLTQPVITFQLPHYQLADVDGKHTIGYVMGEYGVSAYDAFMILRRSIGIPDPFPVEGGTAKENSSSGIINLGQAVLKPETGFVTMPLQLLNAKNINTIVIEITYADKNTSLKSYNLCLPDDWIYTVKEDKGILKIACAGLTPLTDRELGTLNISGIGSNGLSKATVVINNNSPMAIAGINTAALPKEYTLYQNYPNPFNPVTVINYSVPEQCKVKLLIYNTLGQQITELVNETKDAGNYSAKFDAGILSSGIYFYQLKAEGVDGQLKFSRVKKLSLMK